MYILYILAASNGTRMHSGISYCMFQVCNTNFNTVRMKYLGVKSLQLYHIGFILQRKQQVWRKRCWQNFCLFFGEELSVLISEAAMTSWAFSKSLVRTENGTDLHRKAFKEKKRENKHSMKASYREVLEEASF